MAKKNKRKKREEKVPVLTFEQIEDALRRAAPGANELGEKLKNVFRLTPAQMNMRLD